MMKYGTIVTGTVSDQNEEYYYVQYQGKTFALDKSYCDDALEVGDEVEGMIYETKSGQAVIQLDLPDIRPGYYGWGQVVDQHHDLGVFVDVGLEDKDVVVSLDDLPDQHFLWPKKGDWLYLTFEADDRNRFWGQLADEAAMQDLFRKASPKIMNNEYNFVIYQLKLAGSLAISRPEGYRAFLHESERFEEPRLGQTVKGRIIDVKKNGEVNISLKPRAHEVIGEDAQMILTLLEMSPTGSLALHDKSSPEDIQRELSISKGQFKRAVGQLLKEGKITQTIPEGIALKK